MDRAIALQASNRLQNIETFENFIEEVERIFYKYNDDMDMSLFGDELFAMLNEELAVYKKALEDL